MLAFRPHRLVAPRTAADDPRLGHWLARAARVTDVTRVALLGFPSDAGVARNGGRVGAADAPAAIREALYRMTPDPRLGDRFTDLLSATVDLGDVPTVGDVEHDQAALGEAVAAVLGDGVVPIVLGGGHETAYGHALGYVAWGRPFGILNWDAHADVRPLVDGPDGTPVGHSGSPFRQAVEHPSGLVRRYTVAGLHPWRVSAAHAAFVAAHGRAVWLDALTDEAVDTLAAGLDGPMLVSFDLDSVDGVTGVSAPGVGGMAPRLWLRAAEACGRSAGATSFDVVETNPRHDADSRSATLAALTVWHLLRGIAQR